MRFSDNQAFKDLLRNKQAEILQKTSDGVQETAQFLRLFSLLKSARKRNEENDFKLLLISKADLSKLSEDAEEKIDKLFTNTVFLTNKKIVIDSALSIINHDNEAFLIDNNDARRFYASLSKGDMVVFLISPEAIVNYFIDGNDYGTGIFYSDVALKSYQERKTVDKLIEVLDEYRKTLKQRNTYQKFFVPKSQLKTLKIALKSKLPDKQFIRENKQLLINRPEDLFREDLLIYIKQHMRVEVREESVLDDLDRLDIEMYDEAGRDLYFIEIKWIGESIHTDGNKMGTEYKAEPRIKYDAVKQVVGYISQLLLQKANVKVGYLAVFDARKGDNTDSGEGISRDALPEDLKKHFPRFHKLKDFIVVNENPR